MQERIFFIAHYADQAVLYLLILLSLISIVMIFERYGKLKKISKASNLIRAKMASGIADRNLEVIKEVDRDTVEGRALSYALDHLDKNGIEGLDEMFETISKTTCDLLSLTEKRTTKRSKSFFIHKSLKRIN